MGFFSRWRLVGGRRLVVVVRFLKHFFHLPFRFYLYPRPSFWSGGADVVVLEEDVVNP